MAVASADLMHLGSREGLKHAAKLRNEISFHVNNSVLPPAPNLDDFQDIKSAAENDELFRQYQLHFMAYLRKDGLPLRSATLLIRNGLEKNIEVAMNPELFKKAIALGNTGSPSGKRLGRR
jgi:hypothetical protein